MCDTVCAIGDGVIHFAKNSDREPSESQCVEVIPAKRGLSGLRRCTHVAIPEVGTKHGVILSRPAWMWGCEMGANDAGVVGGNEAVFARVPVEASGLTGMDLLRLALERAGSSLEAVHVVTELLSHHAQGGGMGFRNRGFRYSSSFLFADAREAWVLETAGPYWAAERVVATRTISNVLSIHQPELVHPDAADAARRLGFLGHGEDFDFAECFADPIYRRLTGGVERSACTAKGLGDPTSVDVARILGVLRDHGGRHPAEGLRIEAPCAHASFLPTRNAGQTTASMVSVLRERSTEHYFTGTSSPCMSVFKPVSFEVSTSQLGPATPIAADAESLFFRHERLHRAVLRDYDARRPSFEAERAALEAEALVARSPAAIRDCWSAHREAIPRFLAAAENVRAAPNHPVFQRYWRRQSRLDALV